MNDQQHPLSKLQLSLMEDFDYNPETGELLRRCGKRRGLSGSFDPTTGYLRTRVGGVRGAPLLYVHHIIWAIMTGAYPEKPYYIDHINHIRTDNKWPNLRKVTPSQSGMNKMPIKADNSKGVSLQPNGKWRAYIDKNGKRFSLGAFKTKEEAQAVRNANAKLLHEDYHYPGTQPYE